MFIRSREQRDQTVLEKTLVEPVDQLIIDDLVSVLIHRREMSLATFQASLNMDLDSRQVVK